MWHHPDLHGAVQQGLPVQSGTLHHPHEQVVHQVIYCTHLHAYAMRFFWEQHGMVLRQGKKTLVVTKECSNRGTMTKSSRGASKRSCSQTAPSVPGVKKMKRLMQQKLVISDGMIHTLGPPIFGFPSSFNDGSQPPSLLRQWGVRGYFTTRFPSEPTCEGILTTSFLWWQRQIL